MVDDVTQKLVTAIRNLQHDVRRLLSGRWLENTSVRGGRLRFIGGILRLDSGALLDLIGQWRLRGPGAITGDVYSEGKWTQVGDYDFTGEGDLAGNVTMSGDFDLTGMFKSGNVRIEDGKIHVGAGASEIIIDGADGSVTAGNVKIKDGKITVGTGAAQIVIDGATGKITASGMAIDPADGGKVTFPGGAQLRADVGSGIQMQIGSVKISAQTNFIQLTLGTRSLTINSTGFQLSSVPTKTAAATGLPAGVAHLDGSGNLFRIVP
ncbi:hypothetical protein LJR044_002506 [Microbacterium foliorum]